MQARTTTRMMTIMRMKMIIRTATTTGEEIEIPIHILPKYHNCVFRSEEYEDGYEDDYEEEDCGDDDYCTYSEVRSRKKRKMMIIII